MLNLTPKCETQNANPHRWSALVFPLFISAAGIIVCLLVSFIATDIMPVNPDPDPNPEP